MKKTITITMIVIILLNLISVNSFAIDLDSPLSTKPQESGTVEIENNEGKKTSTSVTGTTYSNSTGFKAVALALTAVPQVVNETLDFFVEITTENSNITKFTIYDTVLGNYDLFDIDYTNIPSKIDDTSPLIEQIKFYVIKYYTVIRNLSLAASLLILIYVGIRMATSTLANDKAKYKKMLVSWLASIVLIFFMHLIVIVISVVLQIGLGVVQDIASAWKVTGFEQDIYSTAVLGLSNTGFNVFSAVLMIFILTWYQLKFFIYYLRRTLEVNFLIIISPLVTITYSLDKMGDGKAQAFGKFLSEIILKSVIQIVHAFLYVVFIASAGLVSVSHPILAVLFFAILSRAEKIVKKIFSINEDGLQKVKIPFIEQ